MTPQFSSRLLIALSACYGVTVGTLAVLDSSALVVFAVIGAMVLGLLWTLRGLFIKGRSTTPSE